MPYKGKARGFNQRLDQDPIVQSVQRITANCGLKDIYSAQVIREILAQPKAPEPIPPKYRVGMRVLFRLEQDNQWKPAGRLTGRILQRFHNRIWYYVIQTSDGKRYSLEWYKVITQKHDELMVLPPTQSNIIPFKTDTKVAIGEKAA